MNEPWRAPIVTPRAQIGRRCMVHVNFYGHRRSLFLVAPLVRSHMSLARDGARGGLTTIASQGLSLVVRIVGLVFLARLLPPDIFGLAAIVTAIAVFASTLIYLGLPMAVLQAEVVSERAKGSLFLVNCALGLVLGTALFSLAGPIAAYYGDPRLGTLMKFLALAPVLGGIQSQFRLHLIKNLKFTGLAVIDVFAQLVATAIAIALALAGLSLEAIIAQSLAQATIQIVSTIILSRWLPRALGNWKTEVRQLVLVGLRIFGTTALRDGSRSIVVPIMGVFVSPSALGNYDRAQQLSILPISLTIDQLQRVAVPILSRLRDQPEKMFAYMRRAQLMLTYITVTIFMIVAALGDHLVIIVLGSNWALAGVTLQILAVGAVFRTLGQSMQWLFIASDSTKEALKFSFWSQPLIVLVTLAGLPWGVPGIAIANSLAWAAYWPLATVTATRVAGFPSLPLLSDAMRGAIFFGLPVGCAAAATSLLTLSHLQSLSFGLLFSILTGGALIALVPPVRKDLGLVLSTVGKAFGKSR